MALTFISGKPTKVVPPTDIPASAVPTVADTPPWEAPAGNQVQEQQPTQAEQVAASQQQAAQSVVAETSTDVVTTQLVDEYTVLWAQMEKLGVVQLVKEADAVKKKLQSIAKDASHPTGKPVRLAGSHKNYVEFSACANTTVLADLKGFIDKIGVGAYIDNSKITLDAAKKLLSENELAKYTTNEPGSRTLKTVHPGDGVLHG